MPGKSEHRNMHPELRDSGIDILDGLSWGTHFCNFFESKEDLLQILVPYFKTGLENNEYCLWIVSDPLSVEEADAALRHAVPDLEMYERKQQIKILRHAEWYLKDNTFVPDIVINGWYQKLKDSLEKGFDGMRVNGNEAWLEREVWKDFIDYERKLNKTLEGKRMIVLCTYPLAKCDAQAVFDVSQVHEVAVAIRKGNWEIIEVPAIKQTKSQIFKANKELEEKVAERTQQLTIINDQLKKEIEEHKLTRDALERSEANLRTIFNNTDTAYILLDPAFNILLLNHRATDFIEKVFHQAAKAGDNIMDYLPADRQVLFAQKLKEAVNGSQISYEANYLLMDETSAWFFIRLFPVLKDDKDVIGVVLALTDITEKKLLEQKLERERIERQQEIAEAVITAEENERQELGRELHDNVNQILTSAHLYLAMAIKDAAESYKYIPEADKMLSTAINEIRSLTHSMTTPFMEKTTLKEALEELLSTITKSSGIKIITNIKGLDENKLPKKLQLIIYRILQEHFNNILRHAQASTVQLKIIQDDEKLLLEIKDDGVGLDLTKKTTGIGLTNIRARALLFNGEVTIHSSPGSGFELLVVFTINKLKDVNNNR